jgi:hypothetical protein
MTADPGIPYPCQCKVCRDVDPVAEMAADPDDVHIPASVRYVETQAPVDEMAADADDSAAFYYSKTI